MRLHYPRLNRVFFPGATIKLIASSFPGRFVSRRFAPLMISSLSVCSVGLNGFSQTPQRSYYDGTGEDRSAVYAYLDRIEKEAGEDLFSSIPYQDALYLAQSLGHIDRAALDSASFCEHITTVEAVRERFYQASKLNGDEIKKYLLPMRIKHEYTKPGWMPVLSEKFLKLSEKKKGANVAAEGIFRWISENIELMEPKHTYSITKCGDLDPLSVLRGLRGNEIDLSIFAVGALRSVGVAARIVWTPVLRGEEGGKIWIEYLGDNGDWITWVPSFGGVGNSKTQLLDTFEGKFGMIFTDPDKPINITGKYVKTSIVTVDSDQDGVWSQIMLLGKECVLPAEGNSTGGFTCNAPIYVGLGDFYLAITVNESQYYMTKISAREEDAYITVRFNDGRPEIFRSERNHGD